jgi:hypothetical protein
MINFMHSYGQVRHVRAGYLTGACERRRSHAFTMNHPTEYRVRDVATGIAANAAADITASVAADSTTR